ncbi:MAG: hypothetical protein NZ941_03790 [Candidatus Caldarchaeum sp.]|nr:hypothetical protein [Candidatus Caldarchaeum sp.]
MVFERAEPNYKHRFPAGDEDYEVALHFNLLIADQKIPVIVAVGEREAFKAKRKRILVIVNGKVVVEYAGVDNYDKTGQLIAVLKKPNSEEMYRINETLPPEIREFRIVYHKDFVSSGFDRLGLLFGSADVQNMINYALVRARLEGQI